MSTKESLNGEDSDASSSIVLATTSVKGPGSRRRVVENKTAEDSIPVKKKVRREVRREIYWSPERLAGNVDEANDEDSDEESVILNDSKLPAKASVSKITAKTTNEATSKSVAPIQVYGPNFKHSAKAPQAATPPEGSQGTESDCSSTDSDKILGSLIPTKSGEVDDKVSNDVMIYSVPAVDNSTSYSETPLDSKTEDKKSVVGKKPGSIKKKLKNIPVKKKKVVKAVTEKKVKAPPKTKAPKKAKAPTKPKVPDGPKIKTGLVKGNPGIAYSLVNRSVCFDLESDFGVNLLQYTGPIPDEAKVFLNGTSYLYGAVAKHSDAGKYKIEWEYTGVKPVNMETEGVFLGINLSDKLIHSRRILDRHNIEESLKQSFQDYLHSFEDDDGGCNIELDSDGEEDGLSDDQNGPECPNATNDTFAGYFPIPSQPGYRFDVNANMQPTASSSTSTETIGHVTWRRNINIPEHPQRSTFGRTQIKEGMDQHFDTPLNSLLAFLPIPLWESMVKYSNINANQKITSHKHGWISGHPWKKDLDLSELMIFFSILLEMTLHPTPGRQYPHMWTKPNIYPFTTSMSISRFRQIRAIIHLNDNECQHTPKKDSLAKIRPLLQVLKRTLANYIDVGDELALDEASVASKSKYGRVFIMFNPHKPGGKFHYRFYFVCEADNYNLVRFAMHTRTNADLADGYNTTLDETSDDDFDAPPESLDIQKDINDDEEVNDDDTIDPDENEEDEIPKCAQKKKPKKKTESKITKLLSDLLSPFNNTFRTVNMDRFYNGPQQALAMLKNGILCRGTFMTNRKFAPHSIRFTKTDAKKLPRGAYRMATAVKENMSIFGWNDGCGVHMLSTADGTKITTVRRQIGSIPTDVDAPIVVRRYNKGMQGVDRHDQLRNLFALSQRHQFQKYYMTLIMALIDFALVNATIHYHMVHPHLKSSNEHRAIFMETLCSSMRSTNWRKLQEEHYRSQISCDEDVTNRHPNISIPSSVRRMLGLDKLNSNGTSVQEEVISRHVSSPTCNPRWSDDLDVLSKTMKICHVCAYEGRGRKYQSVNYCYKHGVRACTYVHSSWNPLVLETIRLGAQYKNIEVPPGMQFDNWLCPHSELTCWEKMHQFYLKTDLYTLQVVDGELPMVKINRLSALYKAKNEFISKCELRAESHSPTSVKDNNNVLPRRVSPRRILLSTQMNNRIHRSGVISPQKQLPNEYI